MSTPRFVMMVVVDLRTGFTVGITKKKGPAFLLGKVTFPGGLVEGDETAAQAATREMKEETGIDVPVSAWVEVSSQTKPSGYELVTLAALSDKVLHARQLENEPVWHLAYERHQAYARNQPDQYAPDFLSSLNDALACLAPPLAKAA